MLYPLSYGGSSAQGRAGYPQRLAGGAGASGACRCIHWGRERITVDP